MTHITEERVIGNHADMGGSSTVATRTSLTVTDVLRAGVRRRTTRKEMAAAESSACEARMRAVRTGGRCEQEAFDEIACAVRPCLRDELCAAARSVLRWRFRAALVGTVRGESVRGHRLPRHGPDQVLDSPGRHCVLW